MVILREDEAIGWRDAMEASRRSSLLDRDGSYMCACVCSICCDVRHSAPIVSVGMWACVCSSKDHVCMFSLFFTIWWTHRGN